MKNKKFIKDFVSKKDMEDGRKSCLIIALQNARLLNRRETDTNSLCIEIAEKLNGLIDFNSFIGLVNYLIILDMIGVVFTDKKKVGERIEEVLQKFGDITCKEERKAIFGLRNCFAHNYGLVDDKEKIKFMLDDSCNKMIILPAAKWDGNYDKEDEFTRTIINPQILINKIEAIYEEVKKRVFEDYLSTNLTENELKSRFTIICE